MERLTVERVKRRTMRILKQRVTDWFLQQLEQYFPERGGNLIESYEHEWTQSLLNDRFVIGSNLEYAPYVEKMGPGTNWNKATTRPHAAETAAQILQQMLPRLIQQAFQDAVALEYPAPGRFRLY